MASVLDGAIGTGATFLAFGDQGVVLPFIGTSQSAFQGSDGPTVSMSLWTDSGWVVGMVLLMVLMQGYLGATPGKLVVGIAVVRDGDARPIGLVRTIVRGFAHLLDSFFLFGYLRPLWDPQRRTFADSMLATVVLDTRRPRPHQWMARGGGSSLDPGPPTSWEAPSAPKWWGAATAVSTVACLLGVLLSIDSSGVPTAPVDLSCEMAGTDGGPSVLTGGSLYANHVNETTTRLGVTRRVRGGAQIIATWRWSEPAPLAPGATLRVSFARDDGSDLTSGNGVRRYDFTAQDGATQEATVTLPSDALRDLGDSWTWTQTILVDGVESPPCTGSG